MAFEVAIGTPLAEALNNLIQPKVVEIGWASGGLDEAALSEYIILMLVNGKTQEQIASELSGDLLNLGPDDPIAGEFSRWLFEQARQLALGGGVPASNEIQHASVTDDEHVEGGSPDTMMGEANEPSQDASIPTGPRAMRTGKNNRILSQINKAMDRTSDSVLHRVRPQQGNERINTHRNGSRGPRERNQRNNLNRNMPNGIPPAMMGLPPDQQMQLFAMYEEQARMMAELMAPMAGQMPQGQQGRSLFDRVQGGPRGRKFHPKQNGDDAGMDTSADAVGDDGTATGVCKFNLHCTKADCPFAHQSPAAPPGVTIDINDKCSFGAACKNRKCAANHPSPATKVQHQSELDCKFFPNCTNPHCPFKHPAMPLCRNGADCTRTDCKFTHLKTMCKYNPCLNRECPYKHEDGQKRGKFEDKVWTAGHRSEREFVDPDAGEEELIHPNAENSANAAIDLDVAV